MSLSYGTEDQAALRFWGSQISKGIRAIFELYRPGDVPQVPFGRIQSDQGLLMQNCDIRDISDDFISILDRNIS